MFEPVISIVVGGAVVLFWTRNAILRFIHPTDWWERPWPTLDPYYMQVQRRLRRGAAPPDALESRIRAVAELALVLAIAGTLVFFAARPS